jgi:Tfp pilus assembly ATPase PilU
MADNPTERWLAALRSHDAADLFLVDGVPPALRVHGQVVP